MKHLITTSLAYLQEAFHKDTICRVPMLQKSPELTKRLKSNAILKRERKAAIRLKNWTGE